MTGWQKVSGYYLKDYNDLPDSRPQRYSWTDPQFLYHDNPEHSDTSPCYIVVNESETLGETFTIGLNIQADSNISKEIIHSLGWLQCSPDYSS